MVNLVGPYLTCRAFVPGMIERGFGRIVNVSSAGALYPPGKLDSAYVTSKVALNQLTRHLAAELEGTGVTVNAIHPGDVKTDMWRADSRRRRGARARTGEEYREWAAMVGESGGDPPYKAADLVLRLASDPTEADERTLPLHRRPHPAAAAELGLIRRSARRTKSLTTAR